MAPMGVGSYRKYTGKAFSPVLESVLKGRHTHYWLKGGRGSGKSSFVSLAIIHGMMADPAANGVALRKIGTYLKDSVYAQLRWAITVLGVEDKWQVKISPLELTYLPTGQKILFRGADMPEKIKSTKFEQGYCKFVWFEEADQFHGMEEIRKLNQSLLRGGDKFLVFYTYNPPESVKSWVNMEMVDSRRDRLIHHSDYRGMPKKWLGKQFLVEAEYLRKTKPQRYRHEYLGEVTGTGGEVFGNVVVKRISDGELAAFDNVYQGLDFGYAADPLHFVRCYFDKTRKRLYIHGEVHQMAMKLSQLAEKMLEMDPNRHLVTADSAEPRSIAALRGFGLNVKGARKGPDSVYYGVKFLQDLEGIVIDPVRCPNAAREFTGYELRKDRNGNFMGEYPDRDNHAIDAVRYALEGEMGRKGGKVKDMRMFPIW